MAEGVMQAVNLRCEYLHAPLGIEDAAPRLSWQLRSTERKQAQNAYRVLVATSAERLSQDQGDLWDSGQVASDQSIQVAYAGRPLCSGQRCHWKVRVWDAAGRPSDWSEPACWEMGLLESEDWRAKWIAAPEPTAQLREAWTATLPRRDRPKLPGEAAWIWHPTQHAKAELVFFRFSFDWKQEQACRRALIQMTVDGPYTAWFNGQPIGANSVWQEAEQYDVTALMRTGRNVLAVEAAKSRDQEGLYAGLQITDAAGREQRWAFDETWRVTDQLHDGWREPGYADGFWDRAVRVEEAAKDEWGELPRFSNQYEPLEPAPMLRKAFHLRAPVSVARAYVCGLGYHELYLNGAKVGDRLLDPGQTNYDKHSLYVVHDVTAALRQGDNAVGLWLGTGWYDQHVVWSPDMAYGRPRAICQIRVDYTDGSQEWIVTDSSWKTTQEGPIREDNVHVGEVYDARREIAEWAATGCADADWPAAIEVDPPGPQLVAQLMPPIRVIQTLKPTRILQPRPGTFVFDFGQNIAGWARLRVQAPAGTAVTLRFGEWINRHGFLDAASTGVFATKVVQQDTYLCKGGGLETWQPRFVYHGFQYVEMTGYPGTPTLETLEGVVVHTDLEPAGTFECSHELLNRIHRAAVWTQVGNLHGIPTDCPARERCGWLGDAHVAAETCMHNFHMALFYAKYLDDIRTSLGTGGMRITGEPGTPGIPTNIAPGKRACFEARPDWGSAYPQLPWYVYLYYGDDRPLRRHYPHLKDWVEYLTRMAPDHIVPDGWGDWCAPNINYPNCLLPPEKHGPPVPLTSTAHYYFDVAILARAARMFGYTDDADRYTGLADQIKSAFIERFYDHRLSSFGSQTADALALWLGLHPASDAPRLARSLRDHVHHDCDGHFLIGIHGQRTLYRALSDQGMGETAFELFTQAGHPGFKHLFAQGATTLWECWPDRTELNPPGYSCNHPMQGGFDPWFWRNLAGIQLDPEYPAFKQFVLRPDFLKEVRWAKATYQSPYGPIVSAWSKDEEPGCIIWRVVIPPNTAARYVVYDAITEHGRKPLEVPGVSMHGSSKGFYEILIGSGEYEWRIPWKDEEH